MRIEAGYSKGQTLRQTVQNLVDPTLSSNKWSSSDEEVGVLCLVGFCFDKVDSTLVGFGEYLVGCLEAYKCGSRLVEVLKNDSCNDEISQEYLR